MAENRALRLVVVDDHEMVRQGLAAMLGHFGDQVGIVAEVGDAEQAHAAVAQHHPDVVLCDVRIGADSGVDLVASLTASHPEVRVVMLTAYDDEHYLFQALRAGARGYLLKRVDARELIRLLHSVVEGEVVIDPALAGRVAMSSAMAGASDYWPGAGLGLTQRESEVLALVVTGRSNRAIAADLVVSEDTVKSHIRSLYRKLDVRDRAGATAVALREGLFR